MQPDHDQQGYDTLDGKSYKRHKDALGNFNREYVKEGIFDVSFGRKIAEAEKVRNASDYDDFYMVRKEDVVNQIAVAKEVVEAIDSYCSRRMETDVSD